MEEPTIQRLAERVLEARGADWAVVHLALRNYLHRIDDDTFFKQINRVTNKQIFGILWSAGLSAWRQDIASRKAKELG